MSEVELKGQQRRIPYVDDSFLRLSRNNAYTLVGGGRSKMKEFLLWFVICLVLQAAGVPWWMLAVGILCHSLAETLRRW